MLGKFWRQHGNGAVEVFFESRTVQKSAMFHRDIHMRILSSVIQSCCFADDAAVAILPNGCKLLAKWIKRSQSILLFLHRDHFLRITSDTRAWLQPSNDRQETYAWSKIYRQITNHVFTKTRSSNHHYTIQHYSNHRIRIYNKCSTSCWLVHMLPCISSIWQHIVLILNVFVHGYQGS